MIRIRFRQVLEDKAFREHRRIGLAEVSAATGLSRTTLTRISNVAGYNATLDAIDALCRYFDCDPGELLTRERESL
jgi:putative transcriptional regulator